MLREWKCMTSYKRGDVVLVLFPHSDLRTAKKRPALVVQADDLNTGIEQVIIAMITSNLARRGHPSRYFIAKMSVEGKASGVLTDSIVMMDNLATVFHKAVDTKIGSLPDLDPIDAALRKTLGLN
jgi:mRNA interferase MazF